MLLWVTLLLLDVTSVLLVYLIYFVCVGFGCCFSFTGFVFSCYAVMFVDDFGY